MKSEIEFISCITDRELKGHLEYLKDMEGIGIKIIDRDRIVLSTQREIRPEAFKKFGFYVKKVSVIEKFHGFSSVEVFLER